MSIERGDFLAERGGVSELSLEALMDQARRDSDFMERLILLLEECGVDDRTDEENHLLEWARSFQRQQKVKGR